MYISAITQVWHRVLPSMLHGVGLWSYVWYNRTFTRKLNYVWYNRTFTRKLNYVWYNRIFTRKLNYVWYNRTFTRKLKLVRYNSKSMHFNTKWFLFSSSAYILCYRNSVFLKTFSILTILHFQALNNVKRIVLFVLIQSLGI